MTVSSTSRKAGPYSGNDVVKTFPFDFTVFSADEILVIHTDADGVETALALTADYTVFLNADQGVAPGGEVTLATALPTGELITLTSALEYLQGVDLTNLGGFYPDVIERAIDKATIQIQQLAEQAARSVQVPISDPRTPDDYWQDLFVAADAAAQSATASAAAAAQSETASAASADDAADSEALAHQWASNPEDVEVEPGKYSAYHYMKKAKSIANAEASTVVFVPAGNISSTDVQAALEELDGSMNRVLLATGTANDSASVVLSWTDDGYDHYELLWDKCLTDSVGSVLGLSISADGGATYVSATATQLMQVISNATGEIRNAGVNGDSINALRIGGGANLGVAATGILGASGRLQSSSNTFLNSVSKQIFQDSATGSIWQGSSGHFINNTLPINALKLAFSVGLIKSGKFRLYGVR